MIAVARVIVNNFMAIHKMFWLSSLQFLFSFFFLVSHAVLVTQLLFTVTFALVVLPAKVILVQIWQIPTGREEQQQRRITDEWERKL